MNIKQRLLYILFGILLLSSNLFSQEPTWYQSTKSRSLKFLNGHANTQILGPLGLENRDDVVIGISLLSPNIEYPVHKHAPEEIYLVLSSVVQ